MRRYNYSNIKLPQTPDFLLRDFNHNQNNINYDKYNYQYINDYQINKDNKINIINNKPNNFNRNYYYNYNNNVNNNNIPNPNNFLNNHNKIYGHNNKDNYNNKQFENNIHIVNFNIPNKYNFPKNKPTMLIDNVIENDNYKKKQIVKKNNEINKKKFNRSNSVRIEDYKKIEKMFEEQEKKLLNKVVEYSNLESDLIKSNQKNQELEIKIKKLENDDSKLSDYQLLVNIQVDETERLQKENNILKKQIEEYKKKEEKENRLIEENNILKKRIDDNEIEKKEKNNIIENNLLIDDNKIEKNIGLINSNLHINYTNNNATTSKILKNNNINEKMVQNEYIIELQEKKSTIESKLINLIILNDKTDENFKSQLDIFKIIETLQNEIEMNITQLKEYQQVEKNIFQILDPVIYTEFYSLNVQIVEIKNDINKIEKEIQLKIKNILRKIQNLIKNIDENKNCLPNIIIESLDNCEKLLIDFDNNSQLFENSVNKLENKQSYILQILSQIKTKIEDFLCTIIENLNDKKDVNKNNPIEKLNEKNNNSLVERLYERSKRFDLKNSLKNDNDENEDSFNEVSESQKVNFDEEFISENYEQPELIKKDWTQITILTEDGGQEVEIYFILKAVGLKPNTSYNKWCYNFDIYSDNELIFTEINSKIDKNQKIKDYILTINLNIKNNEEIPIRFKYKSIRKDKSQFYNQLYVGLNPLLANRQAKFYLYCPKTLTIIKFKKNLFQLEKDRKWYWEGIVPENGLTTGIVVSLTKAKWKLTLTDSFYSNDNIKNSVLMTSRLYNGGNNKIISNEIESTVGNEINDKTIKINKNNKYEIEFKNLNTNEAFFTNIVTLDNSTEFEWNINNQQIKIPDDQIKNKKKFQSVVNEILKNDKSQDSDPVKIGKHVKKIMKYKISTSGKNLTASEILENKEGVCEHYTILLNALLNSIGIDALYVTGNCINEVKDGSDGSHAWTLCKWNGKWIPLDPTWGIFSGKLPVSHIFAGFDNRGIQLRSFDSVLMKPHTFTYQFLGS